MELSTSPVTPLARVFCITPFDLLTISTGLPLNLTLSNTLGRPSLGFSYSPTQPEPSA
jgi:hypothetical protein